MNRAHAQSALNAAEYEIVFGNFGFGNSVANTALYISSDPNGQSGIVEVDVVTASEEFPAFIKSWPRNYLGLEWSPDRCNFIVGDFNGDSVEDLLFQSKLPGDHYVLLGDAQGRGEFAGIGQAIPNNAFGVGWSADQHALMAGYFNDDSKADLFFQSKTVSGANAILLSDSSGGLFSTSSNACWTGGLHLCWSDASSSFPGLKWSAPNAIVHVGNFDDKPTSDFVVQARPQYVSVDYDGLSVPVHPPFRNGIVLSQSTGSDVRFSVGQYYDRFSLGTDWSPLNTDVIVVYLGPEARASLIFKARRTGKTTHLVKTNANGTLRQAEALPTNVAQASGGS